MRFCHNKSDIIMQALTPSVMVVTLGFSGIANVHANTPLQIANQQIQRQQQRQDALNQALITSPTVHVQMPTLEQNSVASTQENLPCFVIHEIAYAPLQADEKVDLGQFSFALAPLTHGKGSVLGQCLNINNVNNIVRDVQNRLIERGYTTTRVLVGNQNLSDGRLVLTVVAGIVGQIKADTKSSSVPVYTDNTGLPANFKTTLPFKTGDVLNIRHLETTLENLKRVPSSDADFAIMPSDSGELGASDVLINYTASRKVRGSLSLDDSGSKSTGKYQGSATLSFDNPTWHNDLLYLTYSRDLGNRINKDEYTNKTDKGGSENYGLGYVLPIKNTVFNANASHYTYHQTVAGVNQDYIYSGDSDNISLNASHLAHRDARSKTWLNMGGFTKSQKNYIDDTEIDVQRRKISGWTAGIRHETRFGQKQLTTDVSVQRGTGAFNALIPPESLFNEGTVRTPIYKLNLNFVAPVKLGDNYQMGYQANLRAQYAQKALVPSERMSIGGRYSVRGFDGERTLSGDMGVTLRQDVSFPIKQSNHSLYLGLDAGTVAMSNKEQDNLLLGHTLVGGAIGIKGQIKPLKLNYDLFTGHPIRQPQYFGKKEWTGGVSLGLEF
ncbi:ShlB/FhaC/HecB family hemolysin secretion/activation protein [Moraxella bovis]|uniref:ShlB/FhaC/HecB family hemolysin secretion/activation protein n=1 Tax=Moraxella bovis TaxID=476 RepID=A0AAQ2Q735_MORBO|nr:ShlB/FhaC/HecB family hemolysin secretion/activation protein [Moraxella bovis]UYZ77080.1 ShlB/FhaC/HecB family hemolysin secretion/activation protein [Moraxella bovis]UYZ88239.1 ShlB/FhaC/HecB family hemolysin secretion/activation protein [Moraxella bovis]UYZ93655.1 ShlB/FhaC/HecB family hemolysin secretion/activation protein [Moraxella bovis]UYZ99192.1 ShlB/FhaC/HecB family hemolysin secretion/activation protein [Moraxella bovis]UZA01859.1 ShlB/FhaC/HecB family hemolysin secretion/activati